MRRRPAGVGTIVEVRSDLDSLRAIVPDWEALAADAAEPNPFYEHWMLLPALEAYGLGEDFRCIVVWENGVLIGLLPMHLDRRFHGLPLRTLRSWRHRNMLLCSAALLESPLAPAIEFEWMPADGPAYAALAEAAGVAGLPWLVTDAYARAL